MRLGAMGLCSAVAAAWSCGCFAERERLDTPIVDLVLATREVAAGDSIRGTLEARDASGIVAWVVTARSPFDTVRAFGDAAELGHISTEFGLPVVDTTPPGTVIVVEAVVEDDQHFAIARADTVRIIP
jgi:hypothetical protein